MDSLTDYGLNKFYKSMYKVLDDNYTVKGDRWLICDITFLRNKLEEEVKEYYEASTDIERMKELVDIANICLFLYIRATLSSTEAKFERYLKRQIK